jgi:hypothetical protein
MSAGASFCRIAVLFNVTTAGRHEAVRTREAYIEIADQLLRKAWKLSRSR